MTTTTTNAQQEEAPMTQATHAPRIRNGINVDTLYGTLDAIKAQPELATFQFRATNTWMGGSHNRTTIKEFYGAGQTDQTRTSAWEIDAGEPPILLGTNEGPNPAEYLLHALAACLTTSLVYVAAARGVHLDMVESTLEGDMDVRGALGLSNEVPNRFQAIRVTFRIKSDAPAEKLAEIVARAQSRSAVFDTVASPVPVAVDFVKAA
jgi:uncharacterized OsmC-like protein